MNTLLDQLPQLVWCVLQLSCSLHFWGSQKLWCFGGLTLLTVPFPGLKVPYQPIFLVKGLCGMGTLCSCCFHNMSHFARIRKWLESCDRLFPIHLDRFISNIEDTHWNSPFLFHHFQRNLNRGCEETRSLVELFCTFHISICSNLWVFSKFTPNKSFFKWLNITTLRNPDVITLWWAVGIKPFLFLS